MALTIHKNPDNLKVYGPISSGLEQALGSYAGPNGQTSREICEFIVSSAKSSLRQAEITLLGMSRDAVKSFKPSRPAKRVNSLRDLYRYVVANLSVFASIYGIRGTFNPHILALVLIAMSDERGIVLRYPALLEQFFKDAVAAHPEFGPAYERMLERKSRNAPEARTVTSFDEKSLAEILDRVYAEFEHNEQRLKNVRTLTVAALRSIYAAGKDAAKEFTPGFSLFDSKVSQLLDEILRYDPGNEVDGEWELFRGIYADYREKIVLELQDFEKSKRSGGHNQGRPLNMAERFSGSEGEQGDGTLCGNMFSIARELQNHFDLVMPLLKAMIDFIKDEKLLGAYQQCMSPTAEKRTQNGLEKACFVEPRPRELFYLIDIAMRGLTHPARASILTVNDLCRLRPADYESESAFAQVLREHFDSFEDAITVTEDGKIEFLLKLYSYSQRDSSRGKLVEAVGRHLEQIRQDEVRKTEESLPLDHYLTAAEVFAASYKPAEARLLPPNPPNDSAFFVKDQSQGKPNGKGSHGPPQGRQKGKGKGSHGPAQSQSTAKAQARSNGNGNASKPQGKGAKGRKRQHGQEGTRQSAFAVRSGEDGEHDDDSESQSSLPHGAANFHSSLTESAAKKAKGSAAATSARGIGHASTHDPLADVFYCAVGLPEPLSTGVLDAYEDTHPIHAELDAAVHCCHARALRDLKARVQNAQFRENLRKVSDSEPSDDHSQSTLQLEDAGTSQQLEAKYILKQRKLTNALFRKAKRDSRTSLTPAGVSEAACDSETSVLSRGKEPRESTLVDKTESIWDESEDTGTNPPRKRLRRELEESETKSGQAEQCRGEDSHEVEAPCVRAARQRSDSNREDYYLGIAIPSPIANSYHVRKQDQDVREKLRAVKSLNLSSQEYAIIDSGTSVSIVANDESLEDFDETKTTRVQGFNGSTTRSTGVGTMVGLLTDETGELVQFEVPNAHCITGAPCNLLSVSALVRRNYSVHFTPEKAYIDTPSGQTIRLVGKSGLYWLHWTRTIAPPDEQKKTPLPAQLSQVPTHETDASFDERAAFIESLDHPQGCEKCNLAFGSGKRIDLNLAHRRLGHFAVDTITRMCRSSDCGFALSSCKK